MNGVFFAWELGEWATAGRLYREAMTRTLDGGGAQRYRLAYALPWLVASGAEEAEAAWASAGSSSRPIRRLPPPARPRSSPASSCSLWQDRPAEALVIAADARARLRRRAVARPAAGAADGGACRVGRGGRRGLARGRRERRRARSATCGPRRCRCATSWVRPAGRAGERIALELATIDAEAARLGDAPSAAVWSALATDGTPGATRTRARTRAGDWPSRLRPRETPRRLRGALLDCARRRGRAWAPCPCRPGWRASVASSASGCGAVSGTRSASPNEGGPEQRPFGLSSRELEVLQLVAAGRTNRQIGTSCSSARTPPASTSRTSWASSASRRGPRRPARPSRRPRATGHHAGHGPSVGRLTRASNDRRRRTSSGAADIACMRRPLVPMRTDGRSWYVSPVVAWHRPESAPLAIGAERVALGSMPSAAGIAAQGTPDRMQARAYAIGLMASRAASRYRGQAARHPGIGWRSHRVRAASVHGEPVGLAPLPTAMGARTHRVRASAALTRARATGIVRRGMTHLFWFYA